ncbi:MAG TPA: LysR family transcriptional regulator [Afipia sp.]
MIRNTELVILIQTLAAAEHGSFYKAGQQFGIPASTISRRVRSLEAQMGVTLFRRHRHGIRSTAVGSSFIEEIRRVLDDLDLVLVNASASNGATKGSLRIGLYCSPWQGHLREVLAACKNTFPAMRIQYVAAEREDLIRRLDAGRIDVAILADHARHGPHEVLPLWKENVFVAMHRTHHLAARQTLTWDDLRDQHFVLGRDPGPDLGHHLLHELKRSGRVPTVHQHDVNQDFALSLIGIEEAVTLVYESDARPDNPHLVYREIAGRHAASRVPFYACWIAQNGNPALHNFLDLLRKCSEHQD